MRAACVLIMLTLALLGLPAMADLQEVRLGARFYLVYLPERPEGAPMILALHGGGGDPDQFATASGLGDEATARGYAVIFPAGTARRPGVRRLLTWNGGYCCGYAAEAHVGDAEFLHQVIADAADRFALNRHRVFLTGMSNGSIMAETFAARYPKTVTAVAGVAGTMDTRRVKVRHPVPALFIHGTADTNVPFAGGVGETSLTQTDFAPVEAVVQAFLAAQPDALSKTSRNIDQVDDGTALIITDWRGGGKLRLRLVTVEGGAHHWPGGRNARLRSGKTEEIRANAEILDFFDQYR